MTWLTSILLLAVVLAALLGAYVGVHGLQHGVFVSTISSLLAMAIGWLAGHVVAHWRFIKIGLFCLRHPTRDIRVSISYLYRIKINGRYLLVRGNRIRHQFQPVGGVYKLTEGGQETLERWNVRDDDNIKIDETSRGDLRIRVSSRHLLRVVNWFEQETGREFGGWREFHEELVAPGLLSAKIFPFVLARKVRRHFEPIHFDAHFQCHTLLIADVLEPVLTQAQAKELENLEGSELNSDALVWATEEEITRRGAAKGRDQEWRIGEHTRWTL